PEVRAGGEERRPANLDWLGALLATAGLSLLTLALYAATPEQSPVGDGFIWQLPAAIVCFGLFVWHERRTPHPLINVRRFRDSSSCCWSACWSGFRWWPASVCGNFTGRPPI